MFSISSSLQSRISNFIAPIKLLPDSPQKQKLTLLVLAGLSSPQTAKSLSHLTVSELRTSISNKLPGMLSKFESIISNLKLSSEDLVYQTRQKKPATRMTLWRTFSLISSDNKFSALVPLRS